MKSQRQLQFGEQIKRIISDILAREGLSSISGSYITVIEADASPDIKNVRIFIDIFGNAENNAKIISYLNKLAPHFRHEIGKKITSRNVPEINFVLDNTQKTAFAIEDLLEKEAQSISEPQNTISKK